MRSSLWLWWCATTWMKVKHRGHSQGRKGPREVIGRSINADELHQLRRDQTFQRLKHMAGHLAESARFTSVQNHNWKIGFFVNSFSEHTGFFLIKIKSYFGFLGGGGGLGGAFWNTWLATWQKAQDSPVYRTTTGKWDFLLTAFQSTYVYSGIFCTFWFNLILKISAIETHGRSPGRKCKIHQCTEPQLENRLFR